MSCRAGDNSIRGSAGINYVPSLVLNKLNVKSIQVEEGDIASVVVFLSKTEDHDVQFDWSLVAKNLTPNIDYYDQSGTSIILAGDLSTKVYVTLIDSIDQEYHERSLKFIVSNISGVEGSTEGESGTIIVIDDELPKADFEWEVFRSSNLVSCGLSNGKAYCWGDNLGFGIGKTHLSKIRSPVLVPGLDNLIDIDTTGTGTCAVKSNGVAYCWGTNENFRFGNDLPYVSETPQQITGMTDATGVSLAKHQACFIRGAGTISCMGQQQYGQLGNGSTASALIGTLTPVTGITNAVKIVSSDSTNSGKCALLGGIDAGKIECWGYGVQGEIGDGNGISQSTPQEVLSISNAVDIGAGAGFFCAKLSDETVKCWGDSYYYQIGDGTSTDALSPFAVVGVTNVDKLIVENHSVCVSHSDLSLTCWGENLEGQFFTSAQNLYNSPTNFIWNNLNGTIVDYFGDFDTMCAKVLNAQSEIELRCTGPNANGKLGNGNIGLGFKPSELEPIGSNVKKYIAGGDMGCFIDNDDYAHCWGKNNSAGILGDNTSVSRINAVIPTGLGKVSQVVPGENHICAIMEDRNLMCWGANGNGQLGVNDTSAHLTPQLVSGISDVKNVAIGSDFTCALKNDGLVMCWGANGNNGYLGTGSNAEQWVPTATTTISNVEKIDAGYRYTCALNQTKQLWCWGYYFFGLDPVQLEGFDSQIIDFAVGFGYVCALLDNKKVQCLGTNENGQLGLGHKFSVGEPAVIPGLHNVEKLYTSYRHTTCAIVSGGDLWCWGNNQSNQLIDGTQVNWAVPQKVGGIKGVKDLVLGAKHIYAILENNTVKAWGENSSFQLKRDLVFRPMVKGEVQ